MILDLPYILETRRNHALEHATLHMLKPHYGERSLAGHSNPTGFFIFGDVSTTDLTTALTQALTALRGGQRELAIHEGCGTNMATTMMLTAGLSYIPMRSTRSNGVRFFLLPLAVILAVAGWMISRPLGPWLQANVTTEADLGDLQVVEVKQIRKGMHRVITKN